MHSPTIISILVFISGTVSGLPVLRNDRQWNKFVTYKYPHLSSSMSPWDGPPGREPTCEELRAMWHFSKRQSRITEITNEVPMYKDPFAYNIWEPYVQSRSLGNDILNTGGRDYVYGKVVHYPRYPEASQPRQKYSAYDEVVRLLERSTYRDMPRFQAYVHQSSPHYKSFERLKNIIRAERAREQLQQEQQQQLPVSSQTVGDGSDYYIPEDSGYSNDVYGASNYGSSLDIQPMIYGVPNEAMYTDPLSSGMYRPEDQYLMVPQANDNLYNDRSQAYMVAGDEASAGLFSGCCYVARWRSAPAGAGPCCVDSAVSRRGLPSAPAV